MQATKGIRRRAESIAITVGLALLGLLAALAVLDDVPGFGNADEIAMPASAAIHQDRADSIARLREGAEDLPRPAFAGDRQEQIERLRAAER